LEGLLVRNSGRGGEKRRKRGEKRRKVGEKGGEKRREREERSALIKKKRKFSSYIRKFRMEQFQNHI
jgi:hypothetical protein